MHGESRSERGSTTIMGVPEAVRYAGTVLADRSTSDDRSPVRDGDLAAASRDRA